MAHIVALSDSDVTTISERSTECYSLSHAELVRHRPELRRLLPIPVSENRRFGENSRSSVFRRITERRRHRHETGRRPINPNRGNCFD